MTPTRDSSYLRLPHPSLSPPQRTAALPDAAAQICLRVLANVASPRYHWVRLHPSAACATRLRRLGFTESTQMIWSALATNGQIELHPTLPFHYARLTRLGRVQAKHPSLDSFAAAPVHYQDMLRALYPLVLPVTTIQQKVVGSWSDIRRRYPLQWVIVKTNEFRTEGNFRLPKQLQLWGSFESYGDALTYLQTLHPSPDLLLAHTLLTSLVLENTLIVP